MLKKWVEENKKQNTKIKFSTRDLSFFLWVGYDLSGQESSPCFVFANYLKCKW